MSDPRLCRHCGLPVPALGRSAKSRTAFCCFGCSVACEVYHATRDRSEERVAPLHMRIAVATLLAMAVMMFSLVSYADFVDANAATDQTFTAFAQLFSYLAFLCSVPVLLLLGGPLVRRLRDSQLGHSVWLEALVLLGVSAAFLLSAVNLIRGEGHTYFETVVFTLLLWSVGRYFEARVRTSTMMSVRDAKNWLRQPVRRMALSDAGESFETVPASELRVGELIRISAGDRVPVHGRIIRGRAWVNESVTSGEAVPVSRSKGDAIQAGCIVMDASVDIRVEDEAHRSGLSQLRGEVTLALESRGRMAQVAESASKVLVFLTVVTGVGTFAYWLAVSNWSEATLTSLSVFLVACPCSLGIAVPLVVYFALSRAPQFGVRFRSGDALERAARIDRIFFDRTGTLSAGEPRFIGAHWCRDDVDRDTVWRTVVSGLRESKHPFAAAVSASDMGQQAEPIALDDCRTVPGAGLIIATPELNQPVRIGSRELMRGDRVDVPAGVESAIQELGNHGNATSLVSLGDRVVSYLAFEDAPHSVPQSARHELQAYRPEVLTGGSGKGYDGPWPVFANLSPEQKQERVRAAQAAGRRVAMVGDGLNDSVALGAADLSVAVQSALDINRSFADVQLTRPGIVPLADAFRLARRARRRMLWNIAWSVLYNSVGLTLAVTGRLHPLAAAVAMFGSSLIVLWNSRRWPAG